MSAYILKWERECDGPRNPIVWQERQLVWGWEKKDEKIKDDIKRGWRRNQTNNEFLIRFKSFCNFKFCHGGCAGIFKSGLFAKEVHLTSPMDPKWTVNVQSRQSIRGNALNWTINIGSVRQWTDSGFNWGMLRFENRLKVDDYSTESGRSFMPVG